MFFGLFCQIIPFTIQILIDCSTRDNLCCIMMYQVKVKISTIKMSCLLQVAIMVEIIVYINIFIVMVVSAR